MKKKPQKKTGSSRVAKSIIRGLKQAVEPKSARKSPGKKSMKKESKSQLVREGLKDEKIPSTIKTVYDYRMEKEKAAQKYNNSQIH